MNVVDVNVLHTRAEAIRHCLDARKDAELFVIGPNGPSDFSYVDRIETHPDWSTFGFRLALVPDVTGEDTVNDG